MEPGACGGVGNFKARRMNTYLYASTLAHIPKQIGWDAAKRGVRATSGKSASSSQERLRSHADARSYRPVQHTLCCGVCGWGMRADHHAAPTSAARNSAARLGAREIQSWRTRQELKALLQTRHQVWRAVTVVVQPPAQLQA